MLRTWRPTITGARGLSTHVQWVHERSRCASLFSPVVGSAGADRYRTQSHTRGPRSSLHPLSPEPVKRTVSCSQGFQKSFIENATAPLFTNRVVTSPWQSIRGSSRPLPRRAFPDFVVCSEEAVSETKEPAHPEKVNYPVSATDWHRYQRSYRLWTVMCPVIKQNTEQLHTMSLLAGKLNGSNDGVTHLSSPLARVTARRMSFIYVALQLAMALLIVTVRIYFLPSASDENLFNYPEYVRQLPGFGKGIAND